MEFKRLNSMTGKDPVLNRRIASIFLTDFENFLNVFRALPTTSTCEELKFLVHKHSPSLMIFELESLLSRYQLFIEKKSAGEQVAENDADFTQLIEDSRLKIEEIKAFIAGLDK